MERVIHTVDVVYGSYSADGVKVYCGAEDDLEKVKGKVRKQLGLNFLSMAYYSVKITNTQYLNDEPDNY